MGHSDCDRESQPLDGHSVCFRERYHLRGSEHFRGSVTGVPPPSPAKCFSQQASVAKPADSCCEKVFSCA